MAELCKVNSFFGQVYQDDVQFFFFFLKIFENHFSPQLKWNKCFWKDFYHLD